MIESADFPKISHLKKRAFLAAFSRCGSLSKSAKRAKVDRRTHYNWLKDDPLYVQGFQQAVIEAGDSLEDRLTEMAFDGNVTAAIFLLKGLKPQKFRERIEQTNLHEMDFNKLTVEQLETLAQQWIKQATGNDPALAAQTRRELEAKVRVIECKVETGIEPGAIVIDAESTPVETRLT